MNDFISLQGIFEQGYGFIGKKPMRDKELHIISKGIYSYICSFSGKGQDAFPSQKLMSSDLGISPDTLTKYLKPLKEKGYISVKQSKEKGKFSKNVYSINMIPLPISSGTVTTDTETTVYGEMDTINNSFNNNKKPINNNKNIYTVVYNHYLTKTNLISHKQLTNPMKKAIDKSIKEYKLDQEYLLKIIDRHSQKVELTKDNGRYAKKARTLSQLFGQKIQGSVDLICSEYLDENWIEETKEIKQVNEFKGCKTDDIIARFGG